MIKMNGKGSIVASLAVFALMMSACSKKDNEGGAPDTTKEYSTVKIDVRSSMSKAESAHVAGGTPVSFGSGYIYFTDDSDFITASFEIVGSDVDAESVGDDQVQIFVTKEGDTYKDHSFVKSIPGSSRSVYIVANASGLPFSGNMSEVLAKVVGVDSQSAIVGSGESKQDIGVKNATLYAGPAALVAVENEDYDYSVTILPKPISSRIEIAKFTANNTESNYEISGYQIDGIFINNFYQNSTVAGVAGVLQFDPKGEEAEKDHYNDYYTSAYYSKAGIVHDYVSAGLGSTSGLAISAGTGMAWAYNLLAPSDAPQSPYFPNIIVRFSNIDVEMKAAESQSASQNDASTSLVGPRYLTVTSFYESTDAGKTPISFDQGVVYTISDFEFRWEDLSGEPYEEEIEAMVLVKIYTWEEKEIKPILK